MVLSNIIISVLQCWRAHSTLPRNYVVILLCMNLGHFVPSLNNYSNHFAGLYLALLLGHILYYVGGLILLPKTVYLSQHRK